MLLFVCVDYIGNIYNYAFIFIYRTIDIEWEYKTLVV